MCRAGCSPQSRKCYIPLCKSSIKKHTCCLRILACDCIICWPWPESLRKKSPSLCCHAPLYGCPDFSAHSAMPGGDILKQHGLKECSKKDVTSKACFYFRVGVYRAASKSWQKGAVDSSKRQKWLEEEPSKMVFLLKPTHCETTAWAEQDFPAFLLASAVHSCLHTPALTTALIWPGPQVGYLHGSKVRGSLSHFRSHFGDSL